MLKAKIYVSLRKSVLDPQGSAVKSALRSLGFSEVEEVRIGKYLEVIVNSSHRSEAEKRVKEMCERLLANPVIEEYNFTVEETRE